MDKHPHAGRWVGEVGVHPGVSGPPPSRATCPSPGAASKLCGTPTPGRAIRAPLHLPPPPRAGAAPQDGAGTGAVAGGGGGADSPGAAAAAAAAAAPLAGRGARSAPPPAPVAGPRLLPLHSLLLSLRTCGLKAEIAWPQRGRREISPDRGVREPARFHSQGCRGLRSRASAPLGSRGLPPSPPQTERSGTPVDSSPRTKPPNPSILRPGTPLLPVPPPGGPRSPDPPTQSCVRPRTSSPPVRGALRAGGGSGGRNQLGVEVEAGSRV